MKKTLLGLLTGIMIAGAVGCNSDLKEERWNPVPKNSYFIGQDSSLVWRFTFDGGNTFFRDKNRDGLYESRGIVGKWGMDYGNGGNMIVVEEKEISPISEKQIMIEYHLRNK